jgi:hypothetical protein
MKINFYFAALILLFSIFGIVSLTANCGKAATITGGTASYTLAEGPREGMVASQYPPKPDSYYPTLQDYLDAQVYASQFTSRFDGFVDHFFLRLPPNYDKTKAVPLILWFHALGQGDGAVSDPRMFNGDLETGSVGVPQLYNAIVIGLPQRNVKIGNDEYYSHWLGDYYSDTYSVPFKDLSPASRLAGKADIKELINQVTSRFNISHVFAAGASMGGYIPLRLVQLFPDQVSGAITSAPALLVDGHVPGISEIYGAVESGVYDNKLVYVAVGLGDAPELLQGDQHFNQLMMKSGRISSRTAGGGKYYYRELQNSEIPQNDPLNPDYHVNVYADDFNMATLSKEAWLIDNPAVPNLVEDVKNYLVDHPRTNLNPTTDWVPPKGSEAWYLTQGILDKGGRNFVRWVH